MEMELFLYPWRTRLIFACVLGCYVASTVLLGPKLFGGCRHYWWTAAQRYREQWRNQFWLSLEEVPQSDDWSVARDVSHLAA